MGAEGRVSPHFCLLATVLMVLYKHVGNYGVICFGMLTSITKLETKEIEVSAQDVNFQKSSIPSPHT
jgi:hypothetical protein